LVNAPGTGVVDDKAVMHMSQNYKILFRKYDFAKCKTYICDEEQDRKYVLENS
jgi:uncharacterized circularly permuted ATP-grasp superfamily protein